MQVNSINSSVDYAPVVQQTTERAETQSKPQPAVLTESKPEKTEEFTKLQNVLAESSISLNFSRDETSGVIVVKMVDSMTGESIRQLPTEVSLKLSAAYTKLQGQFIDKQG